MSVPTRIIKRSMLGKPVLEAGGNGKATWYKGLSHGTNRVVWAAKLDGGMQTSWNDYAKVIIPINEMKFTDLESVRLRPYYTASSGSDMTVTVYMHDPNNLDQTVELSHTGYTNSAAGYRELNFPTEPGGSSWGWYGAVSDTPDTCPSDWDTSSYTWAQFQADSVFNTFTIFRISLDYGYVNTSTVTDGCYLGQVFINNESILLEPSLEEQVAILFDRTANALTTIPTWTFGKPTLASALNSIAYWDRETADPTYHPSSTNWKACLHGRVQTGDDWAALVIPVNEIPVPDFTSALWSYVMTTTQTMGANIVFWTHDPENFIYRAEITQDATNAGVTKTSGRNAHVFNTATAQMFYYGEITGTPDTCPTAGTHYTWAQFQGDSVFSKYTIYKITIEMGWEASGTFDPVWVGDVVLNGQLIPLGPATGTHRKTVSTPQTMLATAKTTDEVISASTSAGADWDFAFGGTGYITKAIIANSADITPRLRLFLFSNPPTGEKDDAAANTNPVTADLPYFLGWIDFPAMEQNGTGDAAAVATPSTTGNLPLAFDSPTIYGVLVQRDATATFTATALTIMLTADMEDN